MVVGKFRSHSTTRSALDKTLHDKERLIHFLYRARILADGCGYGAHTHGSATELVDDGGENLVVNLVQTVLVDVQRLERHLRNIISDGSVTLHLGEISHAAQERIGNTRRSARTAGDFHRSRILDRHFQEHCTSPDNLLQRLRIIILQMEIDAETGTERGCEQSASGCSAHQRERVQIYLDASCRRSLVYHDVDTVILHRRIEILLYNWRETVDFIDEKHIIRLQGSQDAGQIARLVEHRT